MKEKGFFNFITKAANELKDDGTPYPYHYDDCKGFWSKHKFEERTPNSKRCRKCGFTEYDQYGE